MRVLHISTYDLRGGAGRAAHRLHKGLVGLGQDSRMLVRYRESSDPAVYAVKQETGWHEPEEAVFLGTAIQEHYIDSHRTGLSNTLFSLPYPGCDLSRARLVEGADLINLHWVARFQSPITLKRLLDLGRPVVWTLHDQWAFTGGCHYGAGCGEYRRECRPCPQLEDDPHGLAGSLLKDKMECFRNGKLTVVAPSRWMACCARKSRLFRDTPVRVIPNGLETDIFRPVPKPGAKRRMGIPPGTFTLLFGGEWGNEKRKGFHELMETLRFCLKEGRFREMVNGGRIRLICFGHANDRIGDAEIPVKSLGYLHSQKDTAAAYAAADICLLPSLEDNLPNTMLEAMSCGTPVVAFDAGGIPEAVEDGITGRIAPAGDTAEMGRAVLSLVLNHKKRTAMARRCRKKAEEEYALHVQAKRYMALYRELVPSRAKGTVAWPQDSGRDLWTGCPRPEDWALHAQLETAVGPHFRKIYDKVLLMALKDYTCFMKRDWEARLEVIERLKRDPGLRAVEFLKKYLRPAKIFFWGSPGQRRPDRRQSPSAPINSKLSQVNRFTGLFRS